MEHVPHIPPDDRSFRYGDGVFETIAVRGGVPYQWAFHMQRLHEGLHALSISLPDTSLSQACRDALHANTLQDGFLRIHLSRGSGGRGYAPPASASPRMLIETIATPPTLPATPATLHLSALRKPAPPFPTHLKLAGAGLLSVLALQEAYAAGADEAIILSAEGHISELASGNLFWVKDGQLFTPSLLAGCLMGSIRHAIMRLHEVHQVNRPVEALGEADAVFATNCNWGIWPVAALPQMGWHWAPEHPLIGALKERLAEDIAHQVHENRHEWQ